jgi:putative endonuclease
MRVVPVFVYILLCADKSFYTGITWNLGVRIFQHNNHIKSALQNSKIPVILVYWERFDNRIKAAEREKEIKGWRREKKISLINSLHRTQ